MALRSRSVSRRYQIGRRIATGDRSELYEAKSDGLDGLWAVKRLTPGPGEDPEARLIREAAAAASLDHSNVVELVDAGQSQGNFVLVLERIEGPSLAECLESLQRSGRRLPASLALALTSDITHGVSHAHARTLPDGTPLGIVHRGLNPGNVLLSHSGAVKVVDFGSATFLDQEPNPPGLIVPVTGYTAPEQARGEPVDASADLFSIGAILFHLLAGEPLYPLVAQDVLTAQVSSGAFVPIAERVPELDRDLVRLLEECTHPVRASRFGSARNLERRIDQFRAARGLVVEPGVLVQFVASVWADVLQRRPNPAGGSLEGAELILAPEHVPDTSDLELPNRESVGPSSGGIAAPKRKPRMERLVRIERPELPRLPTLPRPRIKFGDRNLVTWALIGLTALALLTLLLSILRG